MDAPNSEDDSFPAQEVTLSPMPQAETCLCRSWQAGKEQTFLA